MTNINKYLFIFCSPEYVKTIATGDQDELTILASRFHDPDEVEYATTHLIIRSSACLDGSAFIATVDECYRYNRNGYDFLTFALENIQHINLNKLSQEHANFADNLVTAN